MFKTFMRIFAAVARLFDQAPPPVRQRSSLTGLLDDSLAAMRRKRFVDPGTRFSMPQQLSSWYFGSDPDRDRPGRSDPVVDQYR
jgi:hypothetical protein